MIKITIEQGFDLHLQELICSQTYRGFLEGNVGAKVNGIMIDRHQSSANKLWPTIPKCTLGLQYYSTTHYDRAWPAILCAGLFISYRPVSDQMQDASRAVLLWFQDGLEPILSPDNRSYVEVLDWASTAQNFSW